MTVEQYAFIVNEALVRCIPADNGIVCDAMNYSLLLGGKRIRPLLVLEFCRLCAGNFMKAVPFACAIEMIHTYSLIHDDLPCMDDDDMRRGKPSCHIRFGEEYALLAGDALLTLAFETLMTADLPAEKKNEACLELSRAAGYQGMVGGQMLDLINENEQINIDILKKTDSLKTGALIKAACLLGCIAAGASAEQRAAAAGYAENIGLAFQIVDDILDVTSDTSVLGKPVGSDEHNNKSTYVSLLGLEESQKIAALLTENAVSSLAVFGGDAQFLTDLAYSLAARKK